MDRTLNKTSLKIKGKFSLFFLILVSTKIISGQTPHNEVFDFNYHQQNPLDIIEGDSVYYMSCIVLRKEGAAESEREYCIVTLDQNLNILTHSVFDDDNEGLMVPFVGSELRRTADNLYAVATETSTVSTSSIALEYDIKLDSFRLVAQTVDTLYGTRPLATSLQLDAANKNIVVLYSTADSLSNNTIWLVSYDMETGEKIDEFRYREDDRFMSPRELIIYQDGYAIVGFREFVGENQAEVFIMLLTLDFELIDISKYDNFDYLSFYIEAVLTSDDDIVFATNEIRDDTFPTVYKTKILKVNSDLDLEWETTFGNPEYQRDALTCTGTVNSHHDDGYLICGYQVHGVIGKVSESGDSLWYRTYEPLPEENGFRSNFNDIIATPDGNYAAIGNMSPSNSIETDSIHFKIWIVKIDEDGNIVDKDTTTSIHTLQDFGDKLRIFPNPSSEVLYLELDDVDDLNIQIFDQAGKLVLKRDATHVYHTYMLDISSYSNGTYFIHIASTSGKREIVPLVIH